MSFKIGLMLAVLTAVSYFSYDYGFTKAQRMAQDQADKLWDMVEVKQNEAYQLAVELAMQKPVVQVKFKTIEKKVIKYVQAHKDQRCIANDAEWLHIRAESVREHNSAIGVQPSASGADGSTETASDYQYRSDGEILSEDVANFHTCAENARQLLDLQTWIKSQLPALPPPK